jgi:DNA-directed RNA polymerase subunit RPC12/RpoP
MMDKITCWKCGVTIEYEKKETYIDYRGSDYDTRLIRCKECGEPNILEYLELPDRREWFYE